MDCPFLLQGIFPTQESNLGLLHCRKSLYQLSYEGSPKLRGNFSYILCLHTCIAFPVVNIFHQSDKIVTIDEPTLTNQKHPKGMPSSQGHPVLKVI